MDWIAGILELSASWLIGNKNRLAFYILLIVNSLWVYVAVTKEIYGLILVCLPAIFINIRNIFKWNK